MRRMIITYGGRGGNGESGGRGGNEERGGNRGRGRKVGNLGERGRRRGPCIGLKMNGLKEENKRG